MNADQEAKKSCCERHYFHQLFKNYRVRLMSSGSLGVPLNFFFNTTPTRRSEHKKRTAVRTRGRMTMGPD